MIELMGVAGVFATFVGICFGIAAYFNGKHIKAGITEIGMMLDKEERLTRKMIEELFERWDIRSEERHREMDIRSEERHREMDIRSEERHREMTSLIERQQQQMDIRSEERHREMTLLIERQQQQMDIRSEERHREILRLFGHILKEE